ncbi:MAG: cobalamin B12-binding domain-containing protein [Nitrospirae bacterium]|nr:cobalamin B12-binding domain-containing protein [Nitrospirota bacterium]
MRREGSDTARVLYVHPRPGREGQNHIIPMGVVPLMNSIPYPKLGLFEREVTEAHLRRAKVVAMDLHWYYTLDRLVRLAEAYKRINPSIQIVVGGYTASVLGRALVSGSQVDFVIRGDAEGPFPQLVHALMEGGDPAHVPNLIAKEFSSPFAYRVGAEEYSRSDYRALDWFPSFEKVMYRYQENPFPTLIYPWVPAMKGCLYDCEFCYGNPKLQRAIMGRGVARRTPESIRDDLRHWSADPRVRTVHMISDFVDAYGWRYVEPVFSEKYDLDLYFEFYNLPEERVLDRMLNVFNSCHFWFSSERNHADKSGRTNFEYLSHLMEYLRGRNCRVYLFVDDGLAHRAVGYVEAVLKLWRRHRMVLLNNSFWAIDQPLPRSDLDEQRADFEKFRRLSSEVGGFHWGRRFLAPRCWRSPRGTKAMYHYATARALFDLRRADRLRLKREDLLPAASAAGSTPDRSR